MALSDTWRREFQFTHPGRGATYKTLAYSLLCLMFQFTHPGRGATKKKLMDLLQNSEVSIHAPREGCDDIDRPTHLG